MYTLTSKIGRFTFESDVLKSHARLIRDTTLGEYYSPRGERLNTVEDVYSFIRNLPSAVLSSVKFGFSFK